MVAAGLVAVGGAVGAQALRRRRQEVAADPERSLSGAGMPLQALPPRTARVGDAHVVGPAWEPASLQRLAAWVPDAPHSPWGRAMAYLWAAPVTAAGVLVGLTSGQRPRVRDGVLLFGGARGPAAALLRRRGFAATTLGHTVLALPKDPSSALWAHELVHTRQAERFGILMAPLYGILSLVYGYARHPLERAARTGARKAIAAG